jgi:hypothetical protein
MMGKLTAPQIKMLAFYADRGATKQSFGSIGTWRALISQGLLIRSFGFPVIDTEITPAGRAALAQQRG